MSNANSEKENKIKNGEKQAKHRLDWQKAQAQKNHEKCLLPHNTMTGKL